MGVLDRWRRALAAGRERTEESRGVTSGSVARSGAPVLSGVGVAAADPVTHPLDPERPSGPRPAEAPVDARLEAQLWETLRENPNDEQAFPRLAEIVRRRAGEGHVEGDRQRAADDAVWSLAEELAHSPKAWFPLVELARLSIHDDRDAALRRLSTASERDPGGHALATGLAMLREEQMPGDALNLGVGHWRPRDHALEVGRQLVEAAVECGRLGEASRTLDALSSHPDTAGVAALRRELEPLIARAHDKLPPGTPAGGMPLIDLRDLRDADTRNPFRRR